MVNIIDNSPLGLMDGLAERIRGILKDSWWYPNEHGDEQHTPAVHVQLMSNVRAGARDRDPSRDFPLVQIVYMSGKIKETDTAVHKAAIYFGGWNDSDKCDGWRIPSAMLWAVLQDLLAKPFLKAFELNQSDTEWTLPVPSEEPPLPPYFTAELVTGWTSRYPMDETGGGTVTQRESELIEFSNGDDRNAI